MTVAANDLTSNDYVAVPVWMVERAAEMLGWQPEESEEGVFASELHVLLMTADPLPKEGE